MSKEHWKSFYSNNEITTKPSSFVKFFTKYINKHNINTITVVDLGCGNGRDTYYLQSDFWTWGIDQYAPKKLGFVRKNIMKQLNFISTFDIVYSRFFLHTLNNRNIKKLIKVTKNYFVAETRAKGDIPTLYTNHKRYFTDPKWLIKTLLNNNFEILYFKEDYNLAKYKKENPLIIRVIAKRI